MSLCELWVSSTHSPQWAMCSWTHPWQIAVPGWTFPHRSFPEAPSSPGGSALVYWRCHCGAGLLFLDPRGAFLPSKVPFTPKEWENTDGQERKNAQEGLDSSVSVFPVQQQQLLQMAEESSCSSLLCFPVLQQNTSKTKVQSWKHFTSLYTPATRS